MMNGAGALNRPGSKLSWDDLRIILAMAAEMLGVDGSTIAPGAGSTPPRANAEKPRAHVTDAVDKPVSSASAAPHRTRVAASLPWGAAHFSVPN